MTEKTMTEKDMFLQQFQRECGITVKLLKAYPSDKAELKPSEKSRSARELSWVFVAEQAVAAMALRGKVELGQGPPAPATLAEVIAAFEGASAETEKLVTAANDETLNHTVQFPVGPGKMGDFRAMDMLWITLNDQIHHRGQLSVYMRLAGARVPSIYGPTADETWM